MNVNDFARFEASYKVFESGCWVWQRGKNAAGYAQMWNSDEKSPRLAHRESYKHFVGETGDLHVCHACDNPSCVNPDHLWLGSDYDNAMDKVNKGRHPRIGHTGSTNPASKLTESDVRAIKQRLAEGCTHKSIAADFGVGKACVTHISTGRNWSHIIL